jgi:hypothetical protein
MGASPSDALPSNNPKVAGDKTPFLVYVELRISFLIRFMPRPTTSLVFSKKLTLMQHSSSCERRQETLAIRFKTVI